MPKVTMYRLIGKRAADILLAILALPFFGLLTVFVAPAIKLEDGGPVFFRGPRRGVGGRHFDIWKYRSMSVDAPDDRNPDGSTVNGPQDSRVTRVGRVLRRTSIDEVPQILNVLSGDMSIVGPRPNMTSRPVCELSPQELKRLAVRPGITGPSQVRGRNELTLGSRLKIDASYADHYSLRQDLCILLQTFTTVLSQRGIHSGAPQ